MSQEMMPHNPPELWPGWQIFVQWLSRDDPSFPQLSAWFTSARLSVTALMTELHPRAALCRLWNDFCSEGTVRRWSKTGSVYLLVQLCHLFSVWPRPFLVWRTSIAELERRRGRSDKFSKIRENFPCETQRFPLPAHRSLWENRGKNPLSESFTLY